MPFIGDIKELEDLLSEEEYKICENAEVIKGDRLCVFGKDGKYKITYNKKTEFFRAFSILKHKISKGEENFCIEEKRKFDSCGIMLDVSRNAVMKTEAVKEYIKYMAKMGINMLMLYTEDTFRMEKYPYFGYLRGASPNMTSSGKKYISVSKHIFLKLTLSYDTVNFPLLMFQFTISSFSSMPFSV